MIANKHGAMVDIGDWIADPQDSGRMRKVVNITEHDEDDATLEFSDGGCMGLNEVHREHIWLPGEIAGYD